MSDEPIDDVDDDEQPSPPPENHDLKRLREKAKGADSARAEADAAKRELAFVKAGIDTDDPRQRYFVEGYKGDLSVDAIKTEATASGFLTQQTPGDTGMTAAERHAFASTSEGAAGGPAPVPQIDDYADLRGINPLRSGVSPEQYAISIAERIAASGGDVAYDGPQGPIERRANTPIV